MGPMGWIYTSFPILLGCYWTSPQNIKKDHQGSVPSGPAILASIRQFFFCSDPERIKFEELNPVEPAWWYGCIWGCMYHFNPFQVLRFQRQKYQWMNWISNQHLLISPKVFIAQTLVLSPAFRDDKARQTEQGQEWNRDALSYLAPQKNPTWTSFLPQIAYFSYVM